MIVEKQIFFRGDYLDSKIEDELYDDSKENKKTYFHFWFFLFLLVNTSKADNLAPESIKGARTVSTATAKLLLDKGYPFVDVRGLDDFKIGHIPGAYHLSLKSSFDEQNLIDIIEKNQAVVIYCNGISCMGSSIATKTAIDWGWSNVFYYREGIKDWKQQGHSIQSINQ